MIESQWRLGFWISLMFRFRFSAMASISTVPITPGSASWREGMSSDNIKGLVLALSSSFFIRVSFIVKKKGLKKAGAFGVRAGFFKNVEIVSPRDDFQFFFFFF